MHINFDKNEEQVVKNYQNTLNLSDKLSVTIAKGPKPFEGTLDDVPKNIQNHFDHVTKDFIPVHITITSREITIIVAKRHSGPVTGPITPVNKVQDNSYYQNWSDPTHPHLHLVSAFRYQLHENACKIDGHTLVNTYGKDRLALVDLWYGYDPMP